jgi:outer membrane protein assembly factor BamB
MFKALWKMFFPQYAGSEFTTVRYAFPLIIVTAVLAGLASVVSENNSYVTVETSSETVSEDEQFTVDVKVTAHVPVNAVDLVISYPEDSVVVDGIDTGTSVITLWAEEPYAKDGNVYLRGGTFRKGFLGEHTIARIKAHATKPGEARILIKDTQLVAGDGKGTEVPALKDSFSNAVKIQVTGSDGVISGKVALSIITDTDGDGDVDIRDISAFMSAWSTKSSIFDFNGDGRMTFIDFSILLADSFRK